MNVLVIPEDFRKDQYILKPIIDAMMTSLGRPRARVVVCKEPLHLPSSWSWREIRREVNPKETYFMPFARQRGVQDGPGEGRRFLAFEAARRYDRIRRLCPESVLVLEDRVRRWVEREVR